MYFTTDSGPRPRVALCMPLFSDMTHSAFHGVELWQRIGLRAPPKLKCDPFGALFLGSFINCCRQVI